LRCPGRHGRSRLHRQLRPLLWVDAVDRCHNAEHFLDPEYAVGRLSDDRRQPDDATGVPVVVLGNAS